jgi:hypothetical protein
MAETGLSEDASTLKNIKKIGPSKRADRNQLN